LRLAQEQGRRDAVPEGSIPTNLLAHKDSEFVHTMPFDRPCLRFTVLRFTVLRFTVLLLTALLVPGCAANAQAQDDYDSPPFASIGFHPSACPFEVFDDETITCGYLTVPQNRAEPEDSITIDLAVAIIHAGGTRPRQDPILYLEGGPGGSALADPDYWLESILHTSRDIILLDQRGTGFSLPSLDCPEVDAYLEYEDSGYDDILVAAGACRDRLTLDGVDVAQYNSANSAADVADLRLALGIDEWNLYGVSYGTRLALTVMRDHPQGVRAVVLDSVYPPNAPGYTEDALNSITAVERLIAGCTEDDECNAAFPSLKRRFYRSVAALNSEPVAIDGYTTTGDDLVNFLFDSLYNTALIPYLPLVIYAASEGDFAPWTALDEYVNGDEGYGNMRQDDEPAVNDGDSQGMFYSVECHEAAIFGDYAAAAELVEDYPSAVTEGLLAGLEETFAICDLWEAGDGGAIESRPVFSELPTLIVAGEYDPVTPTRWSQLAAETLPNSFYVEMPRGGHGVTFDDECGARIVRAFLNRPDRRPATSCMEDAYYPFVLDADELP
jgi:pimeloyl-ACP methyl ester carboxylesterase